MMLKYALTVGIMTDTQAIDVVTFDFKGTRVRCFVSGSNDYQVKFSRYRSFLNRCKFE